MRNKRRNEEERRWGKGEEGRGRGGEGEEGRGGEGGGDRDIARTCRYISPPFTQ